MPIALPIMAAPIPAIPISIKIMVVVVSIPSALIIISLWAIAVVMTGGKA